MGAHRANGVSRAMNWSLLPTIAGILLGISFSCFANDHCGHCPPPGDPPNWAANDWIDTGNYREHQCIICPTTYPEKYRIRPYCSANCFHFMAEKYRDPTPPWGGIYEEKGEVGYCLFSGGDNQNAGSSETQYCHQNINRTYASCSNVDKFCYTWTCAVNRLTRRTMCHDQTKKVPEQPWSPAPQWTGNPSSLSASGWDICNNQCK